MGKYALKDISVACEANKLKLGDNVDDIAAREASLLKCIEELE